MRNLLALAAALVLVSAGCVAEDVEDVEEARGSVITEQGGDDGGTCEAETCFDITAEKDLSFIAIAIEACDGQDVTLSLQEADGTPVPIDPSPHGKGKSCDGVDPDALKFEGLKTDHYILCVQASAGSLGDLTVTTKAGRVCEVTTFEGECEGCDGGAGGGDGTGGSGTDGAGGGGTTESGGTGGGTTESGSGGAATETSSAGTGTYVP